MQYYKSELFSKMLQQQATVFKALAHPARLAILEYIADTKTCISGDISDELPLSRTTIKQHLNELKNAGFIKGEISGTKTNYCLNTCAIEKMGIEISDFFEKLLKNSPDECQ